MSLLGRIFGDAQADEASYLPDAADQERRRTLAEVMRYWLSRDGQLLQPEVMAEIHARRWEDRLAPTVETIGDPVFNNAYHQLQHYFSDQDIRLEMPDYKTSQIDAMKLYIEKLEGSFS